MNQGQLRFLESAENVRRLVRERTGKTLSSGRSRELVACLQQGRQFFEAASSSPLEIRPLIQFYGMVGFARSLVLARRLCALSTLRQAHGLRDVSEANNRIGELCARVDAAGTFVEFNDEISAINRVCYFGTNAQPKSVLLPTAQSSAIVGLQITLKDVLSRLSGLEDLYRYTFSEPPETESLQSLYYREQDDYFTVQLVDPELFTDRASLATVIARWRTRFPYLARWRVVEASHSWGYSYVTLANIAHPGIDDLSEAALPATEGGFFSTDPLAGNVNVERLPLHECLQGLGGGLSDRAPNAMAPFQGHYLSEFSLAYIGLFLLSSLVRYRPDTWTHAVTRSSLSDKPADDQAIALIQQFLESNLSAVPALIIRMINPHEDKYA